MTPAQFIARWKGSALTERAGAQAHFDDLCDLLGVDKPRDPDNYCFERGAKKSSGGNGWADVWKRSHFGWENKKPGRDLKAALKQLTDYALELENPPLLVVSDRETIEIHTAFTGYPDQPRILRIDDLDQPEHLQTLRWVFADPEKLRPVKSLAAITEEAAGQLGALAETLRQRGLAAQPVAHFLIQCLFCMFAEDENLLPRGLFTGLLTKAATDPERAANRLTALFTAMRDGGDYGDETIAWFNGGLFASVDVPPLTRDDVAALQRAAGMDWRNIDPSIFGTLFERGLNPSKRSQLGAHYTDPATIMRLIEPVIVRPLAAEWQAAKEKIAARLAKSKKQGDKAHKEATAIFQHHLERLRAYRVLDPACGSGNFLYLALKALKDLERRANTEAEALGLQRQVGIEVSPANVLGIEIDPYAAELARVTVWIGELQWMLRNGYPYATKPILKPLDTIENRDALMKVGAGNTAQSAAQEADWPDCDAIVGNPPFLGDKVMRGELGADYTDTLRNCYAGRVPGGADFVTYWFEKARAQIEAGQCTAAGLVGTNSVRGGANRKVLDRVVASGRIFEAWSDEPWINEGAAVRVSLVCFGSPNAPTGNLDGQPAATIHSDLSAGEGLNLSLATALGANALTAFNGIQKTGPFDIPGDLACEWLKLPNPHGRPSSDVLRPWFNGLDVTRRPRDFWIVDFGWEMPESEASLYEQPFAYAYQTIKPVRAANSLEALRRDWWRLWRPRPEMRRSIAKLPRFIATPEVSKHRVFVWLSSAIVPDKNLVAIARADDATFGILHSRFHELWSLRLGTSLEDRPRYTPTTTFETFPFPAHLTPRDTVGWGPGATICDSHEESPAAMPPCAQAIATAARRLNDLRENWLNPPEWTERIPEIVPGYPDRIVAKAGHEADLKKRTLTNLYNARPAWLDNAHKALDAAVAAAYGWTDYTPEMPDEEILRRLLALNLERKGGEGA
jgi:type II restriction/modification system DNA methylase subunit YeeA